MRAEEVENHFGSPVSGHSPIRRNPDEAGTQPSGAASRLAPGMTTVTASCEAEACRHNAVIPLEGSSEATPTPWHGPACPVLENGGRVAGFEQISE